MRLPPLTHAFRAGALPSWLQQPLLEASPWTERARLHALFLGLIAVSALVVHSYLGIELTPMQLYIHTGLVVASAASCLLLVEALAAAWARARGGDATVTTGGFIARAVAGYAGSVLLIGLFHRPWEYTRAIMERHESHGGAAIALSMSPLALLISYLAYQHVRKDSLLRELAALRSLNGRLLLEPRAGGRGSNAPGTPETAIVVPSNGVELQLPAASIARVRADENYCHLVTRASPERAARDHLVRMTLAEALELLPQELFVQVHRSHVVNLACVGAMVREGSRRELLMRDGDRVPVSRSRSAEVRERLAAYLSRPLEDPRIGAGVPH